MFKTRQTPWGKADHIITVVRGLRWVSTPGHGGLMVAVGFAAKYLSVPARNRGELYGGYLCYEEDCQYAIAFYELLPQFPEMMKQFYKEKNLQDCLESLKKTISAWSADYLIARGEIPLEPEYSRWKEDQEHIRLHEAKSPNLIVSAAYHETDPNITQVITADGNTHQVKSSTYKVKALNLLSDCEVCT